MEINLFKHHYFVTVSVQKWVEVQNAYMFIYCRPKDVEKTILAIFPEDTKVGINTVTKLD